MHSSKSSRSLTGKNYIHRPTWIGWHISCYATYDYDSTEKAVKMIKDCLFMTSADAL